MTEAILPFLVLALFFALSAAFVVLIVYLTRRQRRLLAAKLQPIANTLGGEVVSGTLLDIHVRFDGEEAETRLKIFPGSKNQPPTLALKRMTVLGFDLDIGREDAMVRALEKIHLVKDVKTGDPIFDPKYLIRSKSPEQAQSFLLEGGRREAVDHFFDAGFTDLHADSRMVSVSKMQYTNADLEPELVRRHLEAMRKFISG